MLSTVAKDVEEAAREAGGVDFWDSLEPFVIMKMKEMQLEDLINLMWCALEVEKGTNTFYKELEAELSKRMLRIKDEEFQTLISCFSKDNNPVKQNNFSDRFMNIILRVIHEKKDRFQLRTLVHIIWSLAKIDFSSDLVIDNLLDLKAYPRLVEGLGGMYQKSQCILLWTYSRDKRLLDKEFLVKIMDAML